MFDYKEPGRRMICGKEARNGLPSILEEEKKTRVLIVCGKSIARTAGIQEIELLLGDRVVGIFDGARAHVPEDSVQDGVARARSLKIDVLVSIGGGSAIDTAKAIYAQLAGDIVHVAIPTTLSSAECTGIFGVTKLEGEKVLFADPAFAPSVLCYDPELTLETPDELWFSTALRTLDHAIERSYSRVTNALNDALCLHAMKLVAEWLPRNLMRKDDLESRCMLMHASFLSMSGPSATCLSHAIGHQIGPRYVNSRFDSTAVTQPHIMAFNRAFCVKKQRDMAMALGAEIQGLSEEEAARAATDEVERLIQLLPAFGIKVPRRLRETGIKQDELPDIAARVWKSPRLSNNPRTVHHVHEIEDLLTQMW